MALNRLGLGPIGEVVSGSITASGATFGGSYDALGMQSVSVQIAGSFTGTLTFQVSNDGTNWSTKSLVSSSGVLTSSTTTPILVAGDIGARYFRVLGSSWTGGTTASIILTFSGASQSSTAAPPASQVVSGTVSTLPAQTEQLETTTNLSANGTYTGASRDLGAVVASRSTLLRVVVLHTAGQVPGTLYVDESTDSSSWRQTRQVPVPSDSSYRTFEFPIHSRYHRVRFVNGATAQTAIYLQTLRVQGEGATSSAQSNLSFVLSLSPLSANGTFTSSALDLGDNHTWDTVRLRVHTDQSSVTDGVRVETSIDGSNWGYSFLAAATKASDSRVVTLEQPIAERYVRLVVLNGSTAQTFLRASLSLVSL